MVAEIYPIQRLPRRFGFFDYAVPAGRTLRRGDFVLAPLRGRSVIGIVARTKPDAPTNFKMKPIERTLEAWPPLADQELAFFEKLAADLAQAVPTVLHAGLPVSLKSWPPAKRPAESAPLTLSAADAAVLPSVIKAIGSNPLTFVQTTDLRRMTAVVAGYRHEHPNETIVAVTPNARDAAMVARHLAALQPWLLTGQEKPTERAAAWAEFRAAPDGLLVGTRLAAVASHPKINALFILRSGHQNHKQADRNPRYDARRAAKIKAGIFGSRLIFLDSLPRADDLVDFENRLTDFGSKADIQIVDMRQERPLSPKPILGASTVAAMETALAAGQKVLLAYNRKGVASRLRCGDCQFAFPCPKCTGQLTIYEQSVLCPRCGFKRDRPLTCPKCRGSNLLQKGWGNRTVQKALLKLWPQAKVSRVEKDGEQLDPTADIWLSTNHYLENLFDPFAPPDLGLVAVLDADQPLFRAHYRAQENAWANLEEWRAVAQASKAEFVVQTDRAEAWRAYQADPRRCVADELAARRAFAAPPQRRILRFSNKILPPTEALAALTQIAKEARQACPGALCTEPGTDERGAPLLEISVAPAEEPRLLAWAARLDDSFVIDTDAIS
jgi:primosomal protein N'